MSTGRVAGTFVDIWCQRGPLWDVFVDIQCQRAGGRGVALTFLCQRGSLRHLAVDIHTLKQSSLADMRCQQARVQ